MNWKREKFLVLWLAAALCLIFVAGRGSTVSATQMYRSRFALQAQPIPFPLPQRPRTSAAFNGANTCKCEPPIPSQASATGTCTRTQDDDTFCELTFSLPQKAAKAIQSLSFDAYAGQLKPPISKDRFGPLLMQLDEGEIVGRAAEDVAASLKAVVVVAAFQRPNDIPTQNHFRDILDMLTLQGLTDRDRKTPMLRSLARFATKAEGGTQLVERMVAGSGLSYGLVTTSGCITFGEGQFTFMVRAPSATTSCERPR
jgi:hypothetical protein